MPTPFSFADNALEYKYEIYTETGHGDDGNPISGLLAGDFGEDTKWDGDEGIGGAATYAIKYYVKVSDSEDDGNINLETIDATFTFNTTVEDVVDGDKYLFNAFSGATFTESDNFLYGVSFDVVEGDSVRFTGAVGDELGGTDGVSTGDWEEMFTISGVSINTDAEELLSDFAVDDVATVEVDESDTYTSKLGELVLSTETNIYDTVLSDRTFDNADIASLKELGFSEAADFDGDAVFKTEAINKVTLHEAKSQFEDFGTNIYTARNIGSSDETSLVRIGSTVIAESYWTNIGTYSEMLDDITLKSTGSTELSVATAYEGQTLDQSVLGLSSAAATGIVVAEDHPTDTPLIEGYEVQKSDITGKAIDTSTSDNIKIKFDVKVADGLTAGTVLSDLDFFRLDGVNNDDANGTNDIAKVSKTVVTFQSDVNYDGAVTLKDLAFLNAGALAQSVVGSTVDDYADVDMDYDGVIDTDDLAILSAEWEQTIHDIDGLTLLSGNQTWENVSASKNKLTAGFWAVDPFDGDVTPDGADQVIAMGDMNSSLTYANSSFDYEAALAISDDYASTFPTLASSDFETDDALYIAPDA